MLRPQKIEMHSLFEVSSRRSFIHYVHRLGLTKQLHQSSGGVILSIKSQTRPSRPRFDEWRELTAARGHDGRAAFNTERGVGP